MLKQRWWARRKSAFARPTDSRFKQPDVRRYSFAISPRVAREVCFEFLAPETSEGVGNAGRPMRRQPRVRSGSSKTCTRVFTAVAPESPGIPARNGFTVYFALSPVSHA